MSKMPALFIGHGNPMNTLEQNGYTEAWQAFGQHLPRPQLAQEPSDILRVLEHPLVRGYTMGSLSMTCFGLGAEIELQKDTTCAARLPEGVPPDQTNI